MKTKICNCKLLYVCVLSIVLYDYLEMYNVLRKRGKSFSYIQTHLEFEVICVAFSRKTRV